MTGFAPTPRQPFLIMDIQIRKSVEIYADYKWIAIPEFLVQEHQGESYIKMRATSQPIIKLVAGSRISKNASMSSCAELTELISKRNDAAKQSRQAPDPGQAMFRSEDSQEASASTSTKHVPQGIYCVQIDVNGTQVRTLVQGQRPSKADLTVPMEPTQLAAVIQFLRPGVQGCTDTPKRTYKRKADQL